MTTKRVINRFLKIYESVKDNDYVQKPLSYALYHTWKEIDREEEPRWVLEERKAERKAKKHGKYRIGN